MGISPSEFLLREIRAQRTAAGLTQAEIGQLTHFSDTHVSAVETGTRPPKPDFLTGLDAALKTGGLFMRLYEDLVSLDGTPAWLREWIEIEREAVTLRWFEQSFVPGLLQTEAYARETLRAGRLFSADEVEQRVASRMDRQGILTRPKPPQVFTVLDESVLLRTVDDQRGLMADQLEHIVTCAEMPHVQIHVVPKALGLYPGLAGSFVLASTEDGPTFGNLDHQIGAHIVERATDIARLTSAWDTVMGEALPRRQSLDLIKEVAKTWT